MTNEIHNTFGIKVFAKRFVEYSSEEELITIIPTLQGESCLHIGGGSNLLFTKNFDGTVLHSQIKLIQKIAEYNNTVMVCVGAGFVWDDFVGYTVKHGWSGVENLSSIPGEVGASAVQNIGAYGVEAKDLIEKVECINLTNGTKRTFTNAECHYSYRKSIFKQELKGVYAVTFVTFRLSKTFQAKLDYGNIRTQLDGKMEITPEIVRQAIIDIRKQKLPNTEILGNAGSFFMNPIVSLHQFKLLQKEYPQMPFYKIDGGVKIPAGWLIEQCGWKGRSLGNAGVYEKQALILVNLGGATGEDIINLSNAIRRDVKEKFGIGICPEVNFI